MHPLIAIEPGDRLVLPADIERLHVETTAGLPGSTPESSWEWPSPAPGMHLDRPTLARKVNAKLFAGPLRDGAAAIRNPITGAGIEFRWNAHENPWLGIWLTRGGYRGFHHIAIEPANGCGDAIWRLP